MFHDVDRYVDFITKNRITQPQFLFLYLLRRGRVESIAKYKEAFPSDDGSMIGKINMEDLISRGFLIKEGNDNKLSSYKVTDIFGDLFLKDRWEAIEEIWTKYPGFCNIEGRDMPLTNCDKYSLSISYVEAIDYSIEEHKEVLKDLEYGRANNLLKSNIEKFVKSRGWEKIRELRNKKAIIAKVSQSDNF